jgi:hypothetical protein
MVFAKDTGDSLASLVKEIEKVVAENEGKKMRAFVNLIGEDREALEETAKKLAETTGVKNVPIVVPVESELGPKDFGVSPDAGVTVMLYNKLKVAANHALPAGKLDEKGIKAIIADTAKILQ